MRRRDEHVSRTAVLTWAVIAEIGMAGVLFVWLVSPSAARTAGYGPSLSALLLVVCMLFTAVGVVTILVARRLPRGIRLTVTLLLAISAGGVIPLTMTGLFATDGGGYGFLLALAVIGMEFLAVHIPRASDPTLT